MSIPLGKSIEDLAVRDGVWVEENATFRDVISAMDENKLGVVVVLAEQTPVGILTERDVVRLLFEGADCTRPAIDLASKTVITVRGSRSLYYALDLMIDNNIRRLVVLDEAGRFHGVITQLMLLKSLETDFQRAALKVMHLRDDIKDLVSVTGQEPVNGALEKMVKQGISAIPVLQDQLPVGIVTERDVLKLARKGLSFDEPVEKYMSSPVVCVTFDEDLADVAQILTEKGIKRVVITDSDGHGVGVLTNRDLLKHIEEDYSDHLERKIAHSKEIMNLLPEMMLEMVDTGTEQLIVWANDKALGRYGSEIVDSPVTALIPPMKWSDIYRLLRKYGKVEDVRFRTSESVFEFSGFYIHMKKSGIEGRIQLIVRDITEEVKLATTDPLTSVYNRRYMNEQLGREIERCTRTGGNFAIAIADLDDFKRINDIYGHVKGDMVLKSLACRLLLSMRGYDMLGRYGGEEFMIITPEVEYDFAVVIYERIRADLENHQALGSADPDARITVSIGCSCFMRDGETAEELITRADERLFEAKRQGKNKVVSE